MTEKQKAKRAMLISGLVIIVSSAWLFFNRETPEEVYVDLTSTSTLASSTADEGYDVELLESDGALPFDIYRPITFPKIFPESSKQPFIDQLDELLLSIENDQKDVNKWVELGRTWKMVDDYEGAELAWLYAEQLSPTFYIPKWNLANLYKDFIGNSDLALDYFQQVIDVNPEYTESYRTLYTIYRYDREDVETAISVVEDGIQKNPGSTDLLIFLATHYKEFGDVQQAKSYYEQALQIATAEQNTPLVDSIEKEIYSL